MSNEFLVNSYNKESNYDLQTGTAAFDKKPETDWSKQIIKSNSNNDRCHYFYYKKCCF